MMNKFLVGLLLIASLSGHSESLCFDAHVQKAQKKSYQAAFQNSDTFMDMRWKDDNHKVVGAIWVLVGVGAAGPLPILIGGVGAAVLTKSVSASIQEPRYQLLRDLLSAEAVNYNSAVFKRFYRAAQKRDAEISEQQLIEMMVEKIVDGSFCRENGRPYSFLRMRRAVLKEISQ